MPGSPLLRDLELRALASANAHAASGLRHIPLAIRLTGDARHWTIPGDGVRNLRGHPSAAWACVPSASGARVLTSCADGITRVFDVMSDTTPLRIKATTRDFSTCFLHDDTWVGTADNKGPERIWDAESGPPRGEMEPQASALYPSPTGRLLAIVSGRQRLSLWSVEAITCIARIDDLCEKSFVQIECVAFSPDDLTIHQF